MRLSHSPSPRCGAFIAASASARLMTFFWFRLFLRMCVLFSSFKKFPFKHKRKGSGGLGGASAYVKVAQWGWGRRMMDEARGREEKEEEVGVGRRMWGKTGRVLGEWYM